MTRHNTTQEDTTRHDTMSCCAIAYELNRTRRFLKVFFNLFSLVCERERTRSHYNYIHDSLLLVRLSTDKAAPNTFDYFNTTDNNITYAVTSIGRLFICYNSVSKICFLPIFTLKYSHTYLLYHFRAPLIESKHKAMWIQITLKMKAMY